MINRLKRISQKGFTLIELLIVISIIAILAATIIPNFIGFDTDARVTATKTNLETLRTRITLYRVKEGHYPDNLKDLLTKTYQDVGVEKPYLMKMPTEMITDKAGSNEMMTLESSEPLTNEGGWAYYRNMAEVVINSTDELTSKWGMYEGENPSEW